MYKKLKISAPPPQKKPSIAEIAQYVLHKYEDPSLHPQDPHKARCSVRHSNLSTGDGKAEEHSRSLEPIGPSVKLNLWASGSAKTQT